MKNKILFAAVLATLALSGCNKPADAPAAPATAPGPAGPAGAAGNSAAPQYTESAASSEAAELPAADIGVDVASYPQMEQVPGYPVYYAPGMDSNYFFYDGMYWVYQRDNWYASTWYNGPWGYVAPDVVPLFILRVPVRYYRRPPAYFHGWEANAAPQWGTHWGNGWSEHRKGWDQWNHNSVPSPAPLPAYQREYSGNKYPTRDRQQMLHSVNYHYQPKDPQVEHVIHVQATQKVPTPSQPGRPGVVQEKEPRQGEIQQHSRPESAVPQKAPTPQRPEPGPREGEKTQKPVPGPGHPQVESAPPQQAHPPQREAAPREQPAPRPPQERPAPVKSAPEPKPAKPVQQENRPPQKEAAPHEPPPRPAAVPKEKEEKREEERK